MKRNADFNPLSLLRKVLQENSDNFIPNTHQPYGNTSDENGQIYQKKIKIKSLQHRQSMAASLPKYEEITPHKNITTNHFNNNTMSTKATKNQGCTMPSSIKTDYNKKISHFTTTTQKLNAPNQLNNLSIGLPKQTDPTISTTTQSDKVYSFIQNLNTFFTPTHRFGQLKEEIHPPSKIVFKFTNQKQDIPSLQNEFNKKYRFVSNIHKNPLKPEKIKSLVNSPQTHRTSIGINHYEFSKLNDNKTLHQIERIGNSLKMMQTDTKVVSKLAKLMNSTGI
jgi:hypothetical protein